MDNRITFTLIGIVIGALLMHWLFFPEITTETVTETKTQIDTVYTHSIDTVYLTKVKHTYLRDTIIKEPIKPQIKAFSATFPLLYGNALLKGEVLGEVLKTRLETDFKLPTVTNTITNTKTVTNTIAPKGLFIGASINTDLIPSVGAAYLDKSWLVDYSYQPKTSIHSIGIKKKLF